MTNVTAQNFDTEVVGSETPVLVKFWADWCQPCKMLAPTISKLAGEYSGRVKFVEVNAEDEPTLTSKLKVNSLPTVVVYKNGAAAQSAVGLQSEKALRTLLDSHL
jgi:thioredoxin